MGEIPRDNECLGRAGPGGAARFNHGAFAPLTYRFGSVVFEEGHKRSEASSIL